MVKGGYENLDKAEDGDMLVQDDVFGQPKNPDATHLLNDVNKAAEEAEASARREVEEQRVRIEADDARRLADVEERLRAESNMPHRRLTPGSFDPAAQEAIEKMRKAYPLETGKAVSSEDSGSLELEKPAKKRLGPVTETGAGIAVADAGTDDVKPIVFDKITEQPRAPKGSRKNHPEHNPFKRWDDPRNPSRKATDIIEGEIVPETDAVAADDANVAPQPKRRYATEAKNPSSIEPQLRGKKPYVLSETLQGSKAGGPDKENRTKRFAKRDIDRSKTNASFAEKTILGASGRKEAQVFKVETVLQNPRRATPEDVVGRDPSIPRPADAADVPPGTPPSAGARAYVAGRRDRPSVGGRILAGMTWPFKKVGQRFAAIGSWLKFQGQRADANIFMNYRDKRAGSAAAQFEAEKSNFDVAKGKTHEVEMMIKNIDDEKARMLSKEGGGFIPPKAAKKMEKDRRALERKLIAAQEEQDHALNQVKYRESQTIFHENKRTQIAQHYAELVDNRLRPKAERRDGLQTKKTEYENEIKTWGEKVATYQNQIKALEEKAKNNPYCKSLFKSRIKDIRKKLASSQKEIDKKKDAIGGVFGIDAKLIGVRSTLQKWDNKKAAYSRAADSKIEQFEGGAYVPAKDADDIPYRSPVAPVSPEDGGFSPEDADARADALEGAPKRFGFDAWVDQWNALNGSELKLDPRVMFNAGVLAEYRSPSHQPFDADEFAGIVKVFLRKPGVAASSKLKARDVAKLTEQALESLREKAAAAAMAGETTA